MREVILYRGPLERARLKLLLKSVLYKNENTISFIWILPQELTKEYKDHFEEFIADFQFSNIEIFQDKGINFFGVAKKIRSKYSDLNFNKAHFVGFSSWRYSSVLASKTKVWYVNGVPEESVLVDNSLKEKLKSYVQWNLNSVFERPSLIVTVSKPMTALIKRKLFKKAKYIEIPITTDHILFKNERQINEKKYLVYLGTGAPWQALDMLKDVWHNLYLLDNNLKFRVISRDNRTRILGEKIPETSIEFVGSNYFEEVANWLSEAKMGFLMRRKNLVNEVAFPTKFAEYTASGALVALTELDWDLTSYLNKFNAGVLIHHKSEPKDAAKKIISYLQEIQNENYLDRLNKVSESLSNKYWIPILNKHLNSI